MLGIYYNRKYLGDNYNRELDQAVMDYYNQFDNVNIKLTRDPTVPYQQAGRVQTEDEAIEADLDMKTMLESLELPYHVIQTKPFAFDLTQSHMYDILKILEG